MFTSRKNILRLFILFLIYSLANASTHSPTPAPTNAVGYTFEESTLAAQFRDSISWLRPGDPNGNYTFSGLTSCTSTSECMALLKSKNGYIYSLVGFILVPLIISIILYILYTFCCIPWCCCDVCTKKCCCKPCLGDPNERKLVKYIPLGILAATLIVILWASIEGLVSNTKMYNNLFGSSESIKTEVDALFTKASTILESVTPSTNYIINHIEAVTHNLTKDLQSSFNLTNLTSNVESAIDSLAYVTTHINLTVYVTNPFDTSQKLNYTFSCSYCSSATSELVNVNKSVKTLVSNVTTFFNTFNSTHEFVSAKDFIKNSTAKFSSTVTTFVNKSNSLKATADSYLSTGATYDDKFKEYGDVFFALPLLWIIFAGLGALLRTKYCFKCNWCCAMYLGSTIMLLFSFFAVISVGWADFCVRLDDFEKHLGSSQLGESLHFVSNTHEIYQVINACFYGTSLLEIFNLNKYLNWTEYRSKLDNSIKLNFSNEIQSLSINSYLNLTNQFSVSVFNHTVQEKINAANSISGCKCPLYNGVSLTLANFTFDELRYGACNPNTTQQEAAWSSASSQCEQAFLTAYLSVHAFEQLLPTIVNFTNQIDNAARKLNSSFNILEKDGNKIQYLIINISNAFTPLFNEFNNIIYNYTNCAWLGQSYGGFKRVGCILLFSDMYYMSVAMMVLAFLSILVVLLAMVMDYVVHPLNKPHDELMEWEKTLNVFEKQISSKTLPMVPDALMTTDGSQEIQMASPIPNDPGAPNAGEGIGAQPENQNTTGGDIL